MVGYDYMYWAQGSVIVEYQPKEKLYAGMAELADAQDLGVVTSVKNFQSTK